MQIIDTHCHIHDLEFTQKYTVSVDTIIKDAAQVGVTEFICVGTSVQSSLAAVAFAEDRKGAYASLAIHPHEAEGATTDYLQNEFTKLSAIAATKNSKIVAIGECGLDYYYHESKTVRDTQKLLFRLHLDLAITYNLPVIFHIRSAFDDFFAILDEYAARGKKIRGVVHSFSAGVAELDGCIERELYVGLNGIMTFTKEDAQLEAAKAVPLKNMLLETDAPFLTPKPFRGKMCELKHVVVTGQFLADLRSESLESIAAATTTNARSLFSL